MSEEWKIQASYTTKGGLMVNVRGKDPEEFVENMQAVAGCRGIIDTVGEALNPPKALTPEQSVEAEKVLERELGAVTVERLCEHG